MTVQMPAPTATLLAFVAICFLGAPALALDTQLYRDDSQSYLQEQLQSDEADVLVLVLEHIGTSCDSTWGTEAILGANVLDNSDDRVVRRALIALGQLGDVSAASAIASKADGDDYIAGAAAEGMALLLDRNPAAGAELAAAAERLASHESTMVRTIACSILGYLPDHSGTARLIALMTDTDEDNRVRRAAAAALALHADQDNAAAALVTAAGKIRDDDPSVAEIIILALGYVRGEKRGEAMSQAMTALSAKGAENEAVRYAAISAIDMLVTPDSAVEHKGTLHSAVDALVGGKSPRELYLLEALELRFGILSGNVEEYVDVSRYPVFFPSDKYARKETDKVMLEVETAVSERTGPNGVRMPAGGAADAALTALDALDRRSTRLLMEKAHYDSVDSVRSSAIDAAIAVAARRSGGDVNKSAVLEQLDAELARRQEAARARHAQLDDSVDNFLRERSTVLTEAREPWVLRVEAAGDILRCLNGR